MGIILVITFMTVAFHKDVSTKTDGKEQRVKSIYKGEILEKAGLSPQVERDPWVRMKGGVKLIKQGRR